MKIMYISESMLNRFLNMVFYFQFRIESGFLLYPNNAVMLLRLRGENRKKTVNYYIRKHASKDSCLLVFYYCFLLRSFVAITAKV
jgi:hypothetical protein